MSDCTCDICEENFCNEVGACERCYPAIKQQLVDARAVISFYGDYNSWVMHNQFRCTRTLPLTAISVVIQKDDQQDSVNHGTFFGGKRARAFLEKYPKGTE